MQLIWSEFSSQNQWLTCVQIRVIVTLSKIDLVFFFAITLTLTFEPI